MVAVRFYVDDDKAGPAFRRATARFGQRMVKAVQDAADETAADIQDRGRDDIAAAGRFGARWIDGFTATVSQGGGNIRIDVNEAVPYWTVFEYGKVISGDPLLWIPLGYQEGVNPAAGIRARDYGSLLFRVDRKSDGLPLLLEPLNPSAGTRRRRAGSGGGGSATTARAGGETAVVRYFGKESVTIPKKFHIHEIVREAAGRMGGLVKEFFRSG
jgi:hypothetical protein